MKLTIIAKIRNTRTRFLQPMHSKCIKSTIVYFFLEDAGHVPWSSSLA